MNVLTKVLLGSAPVIGGLVAAAFFTPASIPYLGRQAILFAWGGVGIIVVESWLFGTPFRQIPAALGVRCTSSRAVAVAAIASVPMWLFPPLFGWLIGVSIEVAGNWPAIVVGVLLLNGIAEELIHRGFIFTHLRSEWSFGRAAAVSAAIFAVQHVYLIFTVGPSIGLASIVLATGLTFPLSYLFERGGRSLAAPALLHTSSNAPIMIFSAGGSPPMLVLMHMLVVLASMYLIFAFRHWLESSSITPSSPRSSRSRSV